jgi:hypothetical protein
VCSYFICSKSLRDVSSGRSDQCGPGRQGRILPAGEVALHDIPRGLSPLAELKTGNLSTPLRRVCHQ